MKKIFIDTNILIDYSKGHSQLLGQLLKEQSEQKTELYVNSIIIAEYFTDIYLRDKEKNKKAINFFLLFQIADINKEIGIIAGNLLREQKIQFIGDAFIAATCIHYQLLLWTRNIKDFKKAKDLRFFSLEI